MPGARRRRQARQRFTRAGGRSLVDYVIPPARAGSAASSGGQVYAALDLGTNNCRLLIAAPTRHGFRVVDSFSRIVRLGEGLHGSERLSDAAMDRTIGALQACATRLGRRRIHAIRAVATEACRRAVNGRAFLDRVLRETGLTIDIISTREEAELALESCTALLQTDLPVDNAAATGAPATDASATASAMAPPVTRALLFDIGGGSTEIAWVRLGGPHPALGRPELVGTQSLPLGVITLAELFGGDAHSEAGYEAMVQHVMDQLHRFEAVHRIGSEVRRGTVRLLGTSGTVTTLASVALGLSRYRRVLVDGIVLSRPAAQDAVARLRALGPDGLRSHCCVGPERALYVLPGCAIFDAIHRLWPTDSVVVADRGLRDGMLLRMMRDHAPAEAGLHARPETRRPARSRAMPPGPATPGHEAMAAS